MIFHLLTSKAEGLDISRMHREAAASFHVVQPIHRASNVYRLSGQWNWSGLSTGWSSDRPHTSPWCRAMDDDRGLGCLSLYPFCRGAVNQKHLGSSQVGGIAPVH